MGVNNSLSDKRPYKVYTALLTQSGTSAPVAEVTENTLGFVPTFNYSGVGDYSSINSEWFDFINKKVVCFKNEACLSALNTVRIGYSYEDGTIYLFTYNDFTPSNNMLSDGDNYFKTSIEIRVYE